jgi:hypothetical protein
MSAVERTTRTRCAERQHQEPAVLARILRSMSAQRQVALHGMAESLELRECLRVIEAYNPDAAPAAAVFARIAEGGMVATALRFEAEL